MKMELDDLKQNKLKKNVLIYGIKDKPDREKNRKNLIEDIKLEFPNLKEDDIEKIYKLGQPRTDNRRTGNNNRPIKIVMKKEEYKFQIFERRRELAKKGVYVNEEITNYRKYILNKALIMKKNNEIKNCWTFNGKIYVTTNKEEKFVIMKEMDFDKI